MRFRVALLQLMPRHDDLAFNLDEIRAWRRRSPWGNASRPARCYGRLAADEVEEPFVGVNARGEHFAEVGRERAHGHEAADAARSEAAAS